MMPVFDREIEMKLQLLVFHGHEVIGEYPIKSMLDSDDAVKDVLTKLKTELSGVILGEYGVIAHSSNLPKANAWFNELVLNV